jgi:RHS repeat-associated protein
MAARLRAALALALLSGAAGAALACPDDGGPTCGGGSAPASQQTTASVNIGAGNPINVMTGNKYQREDDLPALPGVLGLEIVRHYNSRFSGPAAMPGVVGRGWKLSYETELAVEGDAIRVWQADGSSFMFRRDLVNRAMANGADPASGSIAIHRNRAGRDEYLWRWADGRELSFDQRGKLVQIKAATGEILSLLYDVKGLLVKVTDPQGRSLHLAYLDRQRAASADRFRGVQSIDSPVGRFSYEYGSPMPKGAAVAPPQLLANLARVRYPAAAGRQYHYEDALHPTFLTGITIEGQDDGGKPTVQRYATFGYQNDGRAVLSTHANNVDKVTLNYERPGLTVITNSLGQQTIYRYATVADDYRLLEVRGAGCALCGPANERYGYDRRGRLVQTTRLNARGDALQAVRNELDYSGRLLSSRRVDYSDGREVRTQLLARYEYADQGVRAPSLIARPSVVPGKEASQRFTYNAQGQRLSMTETGWTPAVEAADAARPVSRTTRYAYRVVNGRSLLAMVDGPLSNGPANSPADSDITLIEYDAQGRLQKMTAPGNVITTVVQRDDAGRPAAVTQNDGSRLLSQQVGRDARGAVTTVQQSAWLLAAGEDGKPAQPVETSKLVRRLDIRYNARGQLLAMQLPAFNWDAVPVAGSGRPEPVTVDPGVEPEVAVPDNGPLARLGEDGSGAEATVMEVWANGSSGADAALARRWLDDFGRLVAVQYQGQGISRATYADQGAGQQAATLRDARGNLSRMRYDSQQRLTELVRSDAAGKFEQRIVLRYAGVLLVEQSVFDADAAQQPADTIHKQYDAFGQLLLERQSGDGHDFAVHHAYDPAGRLLRTWLTQGGGGSERSLPAISYAYQTEPGMSDRIAAIDAGDGWGRRAVVSALRWLLPPRQQAAAPPLADAAQVPVAVGWRWGNGLQASRSYAAVTVNDAPRAWRLTGYHDGLHAYAVQSSADGWILGVHRAGSAATVDGGVAAAPAARMPGAVPGALPVAARTGSAELFDAGGNRRWHNAGRTRYELVWNTAGQLVQVRDGAREVARYRYDAQGRRVAKTVAGDAGASRRFIYQGMQLVAEAGADGQIIRQYIYLGQQPVAWMVPARTLMQRVREFLAGPAIVYLHTDHRGAVTAATASDQRVLWQEGATPAQQFEQPLRMAGQYADTETGLSYNMARYYDPRSASFISPDPAGLAAGSLDLYAYAGGDALNYFDPDGWAKLTYYAITAGANGSTALGSNQGFTKARWAFVITDIQGGIKSNVVYDPTGGFVRTTFQGNQGDAYAWNAGNAGSDPVQQLKQYYGNNLISMDEFTIDNFSDDTAKGILSALGYPDPAVQACLSSALPPIPFAPGEAAIDVTKRVANGANRQRILNCGREQQSSMPVQYADDAERDRVEKYEAAAEMNETSMLGKDCSQSGCPGVSINGVNGAVYHASYGRSQFTVDTFLRTINGLTATEKTALGLTPDIQSRITTAITRSNAVGQGGTGLFDVYRHAYTCPQAAAAWDNAGQAGTPPPLTVAARTAFGTRTGLGRQAFIDMICFTPHPPARPTGEGRNAFMSEAIFTDATLKTWVMDIFKSDDKFGYISRVLIKKNLATVSGTSTISSNFTNDVAPTLPDGSANPAYAVRQRAIEEELAMRVARLHNGGKAAALNTDPSILTRACIATGPNKNVPLCDTGSYVQKFIGIINDGHGDWRSLRCTADAKTGTGADYTGRGLEFSPITLPSHH